MIFIIIILYIIKSSVNQFFIEKYEPSSHFALLGLSLNLTDIEFQAENSIYSK